MSNFESFGKYVLLEKLATGGMAEVFLARGNGAGGIGKFFAIKRILPQYADSPEFIEMFKDEAKIAINLNHSNIVSIHEFGVEKGQFYIVMDYVEGRNLRQILNKMKKTNLQLSIDQIVYVIKEVAAGLDHAHRCIDGSTGKPLNITHRDMSPQNLMVSFEGETKIVDFGIAKAESQLETTRAGTLKGKFGYMSPEQAEGQAVDLRTDIFSMGIVMWELLANDRLFVANNEINTLRKIRDCQIPSLRKINPNIHAELERIVQKALARDRNLRYQTSAALHRDLNRFLNRQFPDFSPQDFAVFIKSVFSDEILALRKRLVDYARINPVEGTKAKDDNFDDRTSLLDTSTNSLIVSQSQVTKPPQNSSSSFNIDPQTNSNVESKTDVRPTEARRPVAVDTAVDENGLPPTTRGGRAPAPVLDESALNKADGNLPRYSEQFETEDYGKRNKRPQAPQRQMPTPSYSQPANSSARFATFIVFCLLCTGVYAYLAKYYTPMMSEVIATTDPYIHPFHTALGVAPGTVNIASEAQVAPAAAAPQTPNAPVADQGEYVVVISNPSGAEILIDDKNTGYVTPSRIEIPKTPFTLSVRKKGYTDETLQNMTAQKIGKRLVANLVKMNVAYVNIDVFPPQDAVIFINGKKLENVKSPIREFAVPANTSVKIRAQSPNGASFDEVTLSLPVEKRQSVQLNPRKTMRPSSSNE